MTRRKKILAVGDWILVPFGGPVLGSRTGPRTEWGRQLAQIEVVDEPVDGEPQGYRARKWVDAGARWTKRTFRLAGDQQEADASDARITRASSTAKPVAKPKRDREDE